jgi:hypothetical protein
MATSMSRDESRRYTAALWYTVHEKDTTFAVSEEFAIWWTRVGWTFHREIRDGFLNWQAGNFPRSIGEGES